MKHKEKSQKFDKNANDVSLIDFDCNIHLGKDDLIFFRLFMIVKGIIT